MSDGRRTGKVAWISGAASGIGEGTALLFAEQGVAVTLADRREEDCRRIAEQITDAGGRAIAVACDVTNRDQVRESIEQTVSAFGRLDIVVNNAGIVKIGPLHETTDEDWNAVMDTNVRGMFYATKFAYPHLCAAGRGYIVNVGSISSFVGQSLTPVYTTSKHAVLGLTRSIALDYAADGIRCNCVCPGITDTPLLREHIDITPDPEATLNNRLRRVAMGVALSPRDIGKAILYLSCEDSAGITGTTLTIDCGYLTAAEWEHPGRTAFMEPP